MREGMQVVGIWKTEVGEVVDKAGCHCWNVMISLMMWRWKPQRATVPHMSEYTFPVEFCALENRKNRGSRVTRPIIMPEGLVNWCEVTIERFSTHSTRQHNAAMAYPHTHSNKNHVQRVRLPSRT